MDLFEVGSLVIDLAFVGSPNFVGAMSTVTQFSTFFNADLTQFRSKANKVTTMPSYGGMKAWLFHNTMVNG